MTSDGTTHMWGSEGKPGARRLNLYSLHAAASHSPVKSVDSSHDGPGFQARDSSSPLHTSGSGHSEDTPQRSDQQQLEDRGGAAGVVGGEKDGDSRRSRQPQHLLTPSGMMCELK